MIQNLNTHTYMEKSYICVYVCIYIHTHTYIYMINGIIRFGAIKTWSGDPSD